MPNKASATDRRSARYEKLCATIERTQRRFEKHDRLAQRSLKSLAKLERQRVRLKKAMAKAEAQAADALVASTAAPPVEATTGELARGTDSLPAPTPKPKRQRKPKAETLGESCNRIVSELLSPGSPALAKEASDARMRAMGFRKTGKRAGA